MVFQGNEQQNRPEETGKPGYRKSGVAALHVCLWNFRSKGEYAKEG
jgi:hypothetical protein